MGFKYSILEQQASIQTPNAIPGWPAGNVYRLPTQRPAHSANDPQLRVTTQRRRFSVGVPIQKYIRYKISQHVNVCVAKPRKLTTFVPGMHEFLKCERQ